MRAKERIQVLYQKVDDEFHEQFGFRIRDVTFNKVVDYMYTPKDSSSLAVTRILFGLTMLFDIPDERGGASMDRRWGDRSTCHFPLFPILTPVPLPYMAFVYAALWIGALCIMLGYKYRIAGPVFTACYWYLFLIEKSFWNNHSYLFGLVALLFSCTQADCCWSLDALLDPSKAKSTVPYWNYFVLKYQFFILYFMAGLKKGTAEWLTGYSVQNLSEHWVFDPFKYFLSVPQTDFLVVHWFIFVFDLTVAIWMMRARTRHVAMVFCALFHLMNSRLFRIGMFPWVCLTTMPLFYPFDWPKRVLSLFNVYNTRLKHYVCNKINNIKKKWIGGDNINNCKDKTLETNGDGDINQVNKQQDVGTNEIFEETEENTNTDKYVFNELKKLDFEYNEGTNTGFEELHKNKATVHTEKENDYSKRKLTVYLIIFYVCIQAFLPYSHVFTKGYNNWTNGLYGYSWDMMVHTWDLSSIAVKVVDNNSNEEMYLDPQQYTLNDRWSRHGDMLYQYAQCLKKNIEKEKESKFTSQSKVISNNISIYVDIWCSMNGRFAQRMFDSKVDLLTASWSPFSKVSYLMPLLDESVHWREDLDKIRSEVHSWSTQSDVVFYADFPGYEQEKYIPIELKNVTLIILEGVAVYEQEMTKHKIGQSFMLNRGNWVKVPSGSFHKVLNIGDNPTFYMYTFYNDTVVNLDKLIQSPKIKLPIFKELYVRVANMIVFANLVVSNILQLFKFSQCSY